MTHAPYVVARNLSGATMIYELDKVVDGVPIYGSPVTTEVATERFAVKLARYLTIGSQEDEHGHT